MADVPAKPEARDTQRDLASQAGLGTAADTRQSGTSVTTANPTLRKAASSQPLAGRAVLLMLGCVVAFSLMAITIRLASSQLHPFEIAFFRNLFGLLFTLPLIVRAGSLALLKTDKLRYYFLRCTVGLCAMLCGFWALVHLPLAQAVALSYTTPLFVTVFAVLILGEVVRARRWTAIAIGFIGVLVILRPDPDSFRLAALVALASAGFSAGAAISIKFLSRSEHPDAIVIWMVLIMTPMSLLAALPVWQWPGGSVWLWLVLTGALGTTGHLCMTRAFRLADVSALQPLNFLQLPIVAGVAWLLFDENIDAWTVAGAGVIFASTIYIAHREARLRRRRVTDPEIGAETLSGS